MVYRCRNRLGHSLLRRATNIRGRWARAKAVPASMAEVLENANYNITMPLEFLYFVNFPNVGCGAVADDRTISRKLHEYCSIFTAELQAIHDALVTISDSNYQDFTVYSDSKSCIQTINQYNSNHPIVLNIVEWLLRVPARHQNVTLCWVPSHCNIAGNEKADTEARHVAATNVNIYNVHLLHRNFFTAIKQRTADHWLSTLYEVTNNKLRSIKNCIKQWPSSSQRIRHDEIILTRLRIGHALVTHSFLMENGNMPYCQDCLVPLSVYTYLPSVLHMTVMLPKYSEHEYK